MSESQEFRFYLSTGLLTAEHARRMGTAVWEFMWLISHETREGGRVLNGSPITTSRIAQELGESVRTATRNLTRLYQEGYIIRYRKTPGDEYSYSIANSKKWVPASDKNVMPTHDKSVIPPGQKCHAPMTEMASPHDRNVTPNKEDIQVDRVDKVDRGNEGFHPIQYATKILDELHFPATPDSLKVVAACVEAEIKAGKTGASAYEFILAGSKDARDENVPINRFFFTDAKYRTENRRIANDNYKTAAQLRNERSSAALKRAFAEDAGPRDMPVGVREGID